MAKALAVKEEAKTDVAVAAWDDSMPTGFENNTPEDFLRPFFTVLQGLSKKLETVDGARPGLIINTATNELFPDGIDFVVVSEDRKYVRRKPNQGPTVSVHEESDPIVQEAIAKAGGNKFAQLFADNGDELQDTVAVVGIQVGDQQEPICVASITFKRTALKSYKKFNTLAKDNFTKGKMIFGKPIPKAMVVYHLGSAKEQNDFGTFYNFSFENAGDDLKSSVVSNPDLLAVIRELQSTAVKHNYATDPDEGAAAPADGAM